MIESIFKWVVTFVATLFNQYVRDKRADSNAQELGAERTSNETIKVIGEIADEQAAHNAAPRTTAKSLAERLRDEAKQSGYHGPDSGSPGGNSPSMPVANKLDPKSKG